METEKIIAHIIQYYTGLSGDDLFLFNQEFKIDNFSDLHICIQCGPPVHVIGIKKEPLQYSEDGSITETMHCTQVDPVTVEIFSKKNDARMEKFQIPLILGGLIAQQAQEAYQMRIFDYPSRFVNTSVFKGPTEIYKYSFDFKCQTMDTYSFTHPSTENYLYFDSFQGNILAENPLESIAFSTTSS